MDITQKQKQKQKTFSQDRKIRVFAPATAANMVCGFDILGFALDAPGDEVHMRVSDTPGVRLTKITGDDGRLTFDPHKNTVSSSVLALLEALDMRHVGLEIELHKQMPIGSGLGSSAASTVAGLFAANELLGQPLSREELLPFAILGEELACGAGHADNVAPALFGGITLIRSYEPLDVLSLPVPEKLHVSVIFPHVDVPTREARSMIKDQIPLSGAVKQWGNIAGLIAGLYESDYDLIRRSMHDELIEPIRSILIPEFATLREIAMAQGALTFGISGSGPSVFAFSTEKEIAEQITATLKAHLDNQKIACDGYVSRINRTGPAILPL